MFGVRKYCKNSTEDEQNLGYIRMNLKANNSLVFGCVAIDRIPLKLFVRKALPKKKRSFVSSFVLNTTQPFL